MTIEAQILHAYQHKNFLNACKRIGGQDWEDIRNEVVLKIYELDKDKQAEIKNMLAFMVTTARNIGISKLRRITETPINADYIEEIKIDGIAHETIINKIRQDIDNPKRLYHSRIFIYVNMYGSAKECSKEIGIPYKEVRDAYNDYKQYIRSWSKSHI